MVSSERGRVAVLPSIVYPDHSFEPVHKIISLIQGALKNEMGMIGHQDKCHYNDVRNRLDDSYIIHRNPEIIFVFEDDGFRQVLGSQ